MAASPGRGTAGRLELRGLEEEKGKDGMAVPTQAAAAAAAPTQRDSRVRCHNKWMLGEVLEMCTDFNKALLQSQHHICPERRDRALQEARLNFETTVQENITIDGQPWQEASESQSGLDLQVLEDRFDEVLVETATKRKYYPRKIVTHVSKTLKAEKELLRHFEPVVNEEPIGSDPNQLSRMANLTAETTAVSKQLRESMKFLPALIEKTEGLSQVLNLYPDVQRSRTYKEIFSHNPSEEKEKAMDLVRDVESTPTETEAPKIETSRKRKRLPSPESRLYPLRSRSKRKISLHAQTHKHIPST